MTCPALPAPPCPQLCGNVPAKVSIHCLSVLQCFQPSLLGSFSSAPERCCGEGTSPWPCSVVGVSALLEAPSAVQSRLERRELPWSLWLWVQQCSGGWSWLGKTAAAAAGDEASGQLCPLRPSGPHTAPSRALPPIAICSPRGSRCQRGLCVVAQVSRVQQSQGMSRGLGEAGRLGSGSASPQPLHPHLVQARR